MLPSIFVICMLSISFLSIHSTFLIRKDGWKGHKWNSKTGVFLCFLSFLVITCLCVDFAHSLYWEFFSNIMQILALLYYFDFRKKKE
jgi:membrane protease YdiL (CAAX protease family)